MKFLTNANLTGNEFEQVKRIEFTTTAGEQNTEPGALYWAPDSHTLSLGTMNGSSLEIGQEVILPVINQTGATIPDGSLVGYDGATGVSELIKAKLYLANGSEPAEHVLGVATHDITNGAIGHVTTFGKVRGINTTGSSASEIWSVGDKLWANPNVAGRLTNVKPTAPDLKINVAVVVSSHATQGMIDVRLNFGSVLGDGHNSEIVNLTSGDILYYNNANSRWENTPVKTIGGEPILGSGDIDVGGGGDLNILTVENSVTLGSDSNTVNIGIAEFDPSRDTLLVYANSVYLDGYIISGDGLTIVKNTGTWDAGTVFNFVAFQLAAIDPETGLLEGVFTIKRQEFTATEGQTVFTISNGSYVPNANRLSVYIWGAKQYNNAFSETTPTSFTMSAELSAGDKVIAEWIEAVNISGLYEGHASTHATGGGDTITPDMIGADMTVISTIKPTNGATMWYEEVV